MVEKEDGCYGDDDWDERFWAGDSGIEGILEGAEVDSERAGNWGN